MSAVTQGPSAAAGALTGLARALVQQGKLSRVGRCQLERSAVERDGGAVPRPTDLAEADPENMRALGFSYHLAGQSSLAVQTLH